MSVLAAKRYAKAFYDSAQKEGHTKEVNKELSSIQNVCSQSEEFNLFVKNPAISVDQKKKIIENIFKKKVSALTYRFLIFLTDKVRLNILYLICSEFNSLYLHSQGVMKATIHSKIELSSSQVKHICEKFHKMEEKDIEAEQVANESMLGGFKVQIKDTVYDYSIESKLNKFKEAVIH